MGWYKLFVNLKKIIILNKMVQFEDIIDIGAE